MLKKIFGENPFLYRLYFFLKRRHSGVRVDFFRKDTVLYYDGYPRSGNTFLQKLVSTCFPTHHSVHHLHTIAPVKIALKRTIPTFILLRDPWECISSYYLKIYSTKGIPNEVNVDLLNELANNYSRYYSYVYNVKEKVEVISFEMLIKEPEYIVNLISEVLEINVDDATGKVQKAVSEYKGATDTYGSSRPNKLKELEKDRIKEVILENDILGEAIIIYSKLINHEQ